MKQNTNHHATAGKPAADTTNSTASAPRRRYEATPATAALLDCMTDVSDMYCRITDVLAQCYGATEVDKHTAPYLAAVNAITEQLEAELRERLTDALMVVSNSHADVVRI